jgi:hypothetical protein
MSVGDLPVMATSNYQSQGYSGVQMLGGAMAGLIANQSPNAAFEYAPQQLLGIQANAINQFQKENSMAAPSRRVVQVYIADSNENVPLEDSILYTGKQKLTDLTDQELFFELDIRTLLAEHNEKRIKVIDKKVKDRTEHLEPARVRDLKMVVVTVASF